jgi:hypothetical protein
VSRFAQRFADGVHVGLILLGLSHPSRKKLTGAVLHAVQHSQMAKNSHCGLIHNKASGLR